MGRFLNRYKLSYRKRTRSTFVNEYKKINLRPSPTLAENLRYRILSNEKMHSYDQSNDP